MKKMHAAVILTILISIVLLSFLASCSKNGDESNASASALEETGNILQREKQIDEQKDKSEIARENTSDSSKKNNTKTGFAVVELTANDMVNSYIALIKDDGSGIEKLTGSHCRNSGPSLSPDGNMVAFYSNNDGDYDIYIMNIDGTGVKNLSSNDYAGDFMPSWSPDGKKICYHSEENGKSDIYTINADGSNKFNVTDNYYEDYGPIWAPDGNSIYYISGDGENFDIYSIAPDGSNNKKLTNDAFFEESLSFSPDGRTILYAAGEIDSTVFEIFLLDIATLKITKLTDNKSYIRMPFWTMEGKNIVFNSDMDGLNKIYSINRDGTGLKNLTANKFEDYIAGVSSDSKKIIYQSYEYGDAVSGIVYLYDMEKSKNIIIFDDSQEAMTEIAFEKLRENETDPVKIFEFLDKNIVNADTAFADEMIDYAIEFSENELTAFSDIFYEGDIQSKLWEEHHGITDLNILKNSSDMTISSLAFQTLNRKYKLISTEGLILPVVDYEAYKKYYNYLSKQMKAYIDIMAEESNKPSVLDAGVTITLEEYVGRIIKLYDFKSMYPEFKKINYIINMLNGKLWVYFGGVDNTPVFDISGRVIPERFEDFKKNVKKYEGTEFGKKLNEYLEVLRSQNNKRTEAVSDYLESLIF